MCLGQQWCSLPETKGSQFFFLTVVVISNLVILLVCCSHYSPKQRPSKYSTMCYRTVKHGIAHWMSAGRPGRVVVHWWGNKKEWLTNQVRPLSSRCPPVMGEEVTHFMRLSRHWNEITGDLRVCIDYITTISTCRYGGYIFGGLVKYNCTKCSLHRQYTIKSDDRPTGKLENMERKKRFSPSG